MNPRYPLKFSDLAEKFWSKVEICGEWDCWPWLLSTWDGYGSWQPSIQAHPVFGKRRKAHQWAWFFERGPVPPGWTIDHICRVRHCCNPSHLRLLTRSANSADSLQSCKTHCAKGHEFTPANTYIWSKGPTGKFSRVCRTCQLDRQRRIYSKKRR